LEETSTSSGGAKLESGTQRDHVHLQQQQQQQQQQQRQRQQQQRPSLRESEVEEELSCASEGTLAIRDETTVPLKGGVEQRSPSVASVGGGKSGAALTTDCRVVFGRDHFFRVDVDESSREVHSGTGGESPSTAGKLDWTFAQNEVLHLLAQHTEE
ncbi:unnamed protein product, partial [Sphacelaria rigidula]